MIQQTIFDEFSERAEVKRPTHAEGFGAFDTDLFTVTDAIPTIGHRPGTSRATRQRPVAYLYFRPDLLAKDERDKAFATAERVTNVDHIRWAFNDAGMGYGRGRYRGTVNKDLLEPNWVRISGGTAYGENARDAFVVANSKEPASAWRLSMMRPPSHESGLVVWRGYSDRVLGPAPRVGCLGRKGQAPAIYADNIGQFILAQRWSSVLTTAVGFAVSGCKPFGDEWHVAIDAALESGQPWAKGLAELHRTAPESVVMAVTWVYESRHGE